jgi:protein ImuA
MNAVRETLRGLRRRLAALEPLPDLETGGAGFTLGLAELDAVLGRLPRGSLHEVFAGAVADSGAAAGFVAGLAGRAAPAERRVIWVRQRFAEAETGVLHAPGLREFGFDPDRLILVRALNAVAVLRAGLEAVRCAAVGAVIVEPWGAPKALDLTATRRLALAGQRAGVTAVLLRVDARPGPSAALTRWQVTAAASQVLAAEAPGQPAFDITLLRHRAGLSERRWRVEWDRDRQSFREAAALPGAVVSVPADRPAVAVDGAFAQAG